MQVTRLTSANNVSFSIATELAMMSPLIKAALSHETLEAKSNIVYLPDISEDALKDVIRFLKETYKDNSCKIFEPNPQYAIETLMAGIYFHFPFCRQACHYCNFHFSTQLKYQDEMLQAFEKEIELRADELTAELESIYFGGGSPSLLSPKSVEHLINVVIKKFKSHENIEITIEILG